MTRYILKYRVANLDNFDSISLVQETFYDKLEASVKADYLYNNGHQELEVVKEESEHYFQAIKKRLL